MDKLKSLLRGDKLTIRVGGGDFIHLVSEMNTILPSCSITIQHMETYRRRVNDPFNCTIYIKDNNVYYSNAGNKECPAYVIGDFTFKTLEEI